MDLRGLRMLDGILECMLEYAKERQANMLWQNLSILLQIRHKFKFRI
jgi:hypothetical protein